MSEPITTNLAKIWEDEQGIMHILFFKRKEFTDADAAEYTKSSLKTANGKSSLVLMDFSNIEYLEMGAYQKLTGPELTRITKASAILVNPKSNFVAAGIGFLVGLNKEPFPMKVFTVEKEAIDWLLSQDKK